MKQLAKSIIVSLLGSQVRRLLRKQKVVVVGVAGSIGKTSTKFAIAQLLGTQKRVRSQEGNYNDIVTVPLVFFGHQNPPNLTNPLAWFRLLLSNEKQLRQDYPYDIVVVELGTDGPGQIKDFKEYIHLDIAVLTAIAPEHMEYFGTLDTVAKEELTVADLADQVIANKDLTSPYISKLPDAKLYGFQESEYQLTNKTFLSDHFTFVVKKSGQTFFDGTYQGFSETSLYSLLAAVTCADILGLDSKTIQSGIQAIKPAPGRMQTFKGIQDSLLLDDSYNASPEAVKSALDTLYSLDAPQRIALLGNMNELGDTSQGAHTEVGEYCDPKKLDLVVTLGPDANEFTAAAAQEKGCQFKACSSPYEAGKFIAENLKSHAAVLVKGSQNGVFAEEALKYLLADQTDRARLVRQGAVWLKKKQEQFSDYEV